MKNLIFSVLVHSCQTEPTISLKNSLLDGFKYVLSGPDPKDLFRHLQITEGHEYFALKIRETKKQGLIQRCSCRQLMGYSEAMDLLATGNAKAVWQLNKKHERMELFQQEKPVVDKEGKKIGTLLETHIWRDQQTKVPRIDLVTQADIERAYLPHAVLKNLLLRETPKPTEDEIEKAFNADNFLGQKQYQRYIEMIHELYMENRAKLIVPFKDDPSEGRLLFPFPPDQRTYS
jgi:hypothetical protein